MTGPADRWARVTALFDAALDRPPAARDAWLASACAGDDALLAEVRAMLEAHDRPGPLDHPPAVPPEDVAGRLAGALAGRYTLERELGTGGMATVFLAHEHKHGRPVVIKVMRPEVAALIGAERFRHEVQVAARLAHPHIVGLLDSGEADGLRWFAMPYLEGESLRALLVARGRLDLPEALPILRDVAEALAYAHGQGVVHRDLKPENVLVAAGHAYLLDFGIAKRLDDGPTLDTAAGVALGTPGYMAPEQRAAGGRLDHRADLYAWGLLAYETLAGRLPAPGESASVCARRPEVPPALDRAIRACLQTDPERRPPGAGTLLPALEAAARPAARRPAPLLLAALALGALVVLAALRLRGTAAERVPQPVAVAVLRNETGDSALTPLGRLAGDWITQGLQESGVARVVPWSAALRATEDGTGDPVARLRDDVGARTVVAGAIYRIGDSLQFRLAASDARANRPLGTLPPVTVPAADPQAALDLLRDRVTGSLAAWADERLTSLPGVRQRPPSFAAYRAYEVGLGRFLNQEYLASIGELRRAYALDTAFVVPLLYAATAYWNVDAVDSATALLDALRPRLAGLPPYERAWAEFLEAELAGDGRAAYEKIRAAAELAPNTRATYALAVAALALGRAEEARDVLRTADPDRGDLRGWSSYWTQRTHAHHLLGEHREEREAARQLRRRFPDRRVGLVLELRAAAAQRDTAAVEALLREGEGLGPATYWSQAAALVSAGEELWAHGEPALGRAYLRRAVAWCRGQLDVTPRFRAHRDWLSIALYDLGEYEEAAALLNDLRVEFPEVIDFRGLAAMAEARRGGRAAEARLGVPHPRDTGRDAIYRARLALVRGEQERAIALLRQAVDGGVQGLPWLHATAIADLALLAGRAEALPRALRPARAAGR